MNANVIKPLAWTNPIVSYDDNVFSFTFKGTSGDKSALLSSHDAVQYIISHYPPPFNLYVSGGIDSQAMLYAWHSFGCSFNVICVDYCGMNKHDIDTLSVFTKIYDISVQYLTFNVVDFLENEHDSYARRYLCGSPQITTYMKMSEMTSGTNIMSGNCMYDGMMLPDSNVMSLYHYATLSGYHMVPFFFLETKELTHAFAKSDYIEKFTDYQKKVAIYQSNGFPVLPQVQKYTGFEEIKNMFDSKNVPYTDRLYRKPNQNSKRPFDIMYRNKYEAMYSSHKYIYHI